MWPFNMRWCVRCSTYELQTLWGRLWPWFGHTPMNRLKWKCTLEEKLDYMLKICLTNLRWIVNIMGSWDVGGWEMYMTIQCASKNSLWKWIRYPYEKFGYGHNLDLSIISPPLHVSYLTRSGCKVKSVHLASRGCKRFWRKLSHFEGPSMVEDWDM